MSRRARMRACVLHACAVTHARMQSRTHARMQSRTHARSHARTVTHTRLHTHTHTQLHTHGYTHTRTHYVCACVHTQRVVWGAGMCARGKEVSATAKLVGTMRRACCHRSVRACAPMCLRLPGHRPAHTHTRACVCLCAFARLHAPRQYTPTRTGDARPQDALHSSARGCALFAPRWRRRQRATRRTSG